MPEIQTLEELYIANPCKASWEEMTGNDRVRFCHLCNLNVYHLSGMKKKEALDLVQNAEGRLCIRFFRRADGTVLTQDCPVGLRFLKRKLSFAWAMVASVVLATLSCWGFYQSHRKNSLNEIFKHGRVFMEDGYHITGDWSAQSAKHRTGKVEGT
jgi:hypothetical protein